MADLPSPLLDLIAQGYGMQFAEKGSTHEAVLWANEADQHKRFDALLSPLLADMGTHRVHVNDLGCGYGAFFTYLANHPTLPCERFYGYDICPAFIDAAKRSISDPRAQFYQSHQALFEADYSFASGTFNLMGPQPENDWRALVKDSLRLLFKSTKTAMSFNLLDKNLEHKEEWLFYADPDEFHHFCRADLSAQTRLSPNPDLKGFTLCVWK